MKITQAKYTEDGQITATINGGFFTVQDSMTSRIRRALAEWEAEGNTITPYVAPTEAELLETERQGMKCSRLQGRLVLGEATCDLLDAMAAVPDTPWAMKQTIIHAIEWSRTSQSMNELAWLLDYTDDQMDTLFRQAMTVSV